MNDSVIESRILQLAERMRTDGVASYLFAFISFAIALAVRFIVDDHLPPGFPFLTFFPAVILTGLFAGMAAGVFCTVLCTLAAWYWFIAPLHSFGVSEQAVVAILFFVGVALVDLIILHVMSRAVAQLRHEKDVSENLAEQQKVLFQELQHRVANNLNFVSNLLVLHQARMPSDSLAHEGLNDARVRLDTMSRVHRRLYDPSNANLPLAQYLKDLCSDVVHATGIKNVEITADAPQVRFDLEKLLNLSLIVVEAVTNSLKHAFRDGQQGRIFVRLHPEGAGRYTLTIQDTGPGFPAGFDPEKSPRLGFRILQSFARSLKGDIAYLNDRGGVVRLTFQG